MKEREHECFETPTFYALRYMDPRLKEHLSKAQKDEAIKQIIQMEDTYKKYEKGNGVDDEPEPGIFFFSFFHYFETHVHLCRY